MAEDFRDGDLDVHPNFLARSFLLPTAAKRGGPKQQSTDLKYSKLNLAWVSIYPADGAEVLKYPIRVFDLENLRTRHGSF